MAANSLLQKVGENAEGYASKKRASSQPTSQDELDCTGSPCGTQKRKLTTLDPRPSAKASSSLTYSEKATTTAAAGLAN